MVLSRSRTTLARFGPSQDRTVGELLIEHLEAVQVARRSVEPKRRWNKPKVFYLSGFYLSGDRRVVRASVKASSYELTELDNPFPMISFFAPAPPDSDPVRDTKSTGFIEKIADRVIFFPLQDLSTIATDLQNWIKTAEVEPVESSVSALHDLDPLTGLTILQQKVCVFVWLSTSDSHAEASFTSSTNSWGLLHPLLRCQRFGLRIVMV